MGPAAHRDPAHVASKRQARSLNNKQRVLKVVALVMGFLIAQCVRFAAVGRLVSGTVSCGSLFPKGGPRRGIRKRMTFK